MHDSEDLEYWMIPI